MIITSAVARTNQWSAIKPTPNRLPAAFHRSSGVSAGIMALRLGAIMGVIVILNFLKGDW